PELGRNGTFVAFRKVSQDVSAFRTYLRDNSTDNEGEEYLAAKIVGRWRSGAPLAAAPDRDAPELAAYNEFRYADDPPGLHTPAAPTPGTPRPRPPRTCIA